MPGPMLVIAAHPGDFVWRAGGAIALAAQRDQVVVVCLTFGERGESAQLWLAGADLQTVKETRRTEAESAAALLGASVRFFDAGDYPLLETPEHLQRLVDVYREVQPAVVLTHGPSDPYNDDHPRAGAMALRARQLAQAAGVPGLGDVIGAPPVLFFEPHQPEQCAFVPNVLLDVTGVWERKRRAMEVYATQRHLWDYYTDLGRRRGVQAARNSGPNLGVPASSYAEAFQRLFPQVVRDLD